MLKKHNDTKNQECFDTSFFCKDLEALRVQNLKKQEHNPAEWN